MLAIVNEFELMGGFNAESPVQRVAHGRQTQFDVMIPEK